MFTLFLVIVYYIVVRLRESYLEFAVAEYYCADGWRSPLTGECLPADSVCNRPEIIRALHCVLQYVSDRPKRSAPLPNAGKPWTEADEAALMQMFDVGCSMEEMQARFQRTRTGIIRRLEHLGRLRPGEIAR